MTKIRPARGYALLRQLERETKIGSIHLADSAQQNSTFAEVLALGQPLITEEDGEVIPWEFDIGDTVVLPDREYSGAKVTDPDNGEELKILRVQDVVGFIKKGEL